MNTKKISKLLILNLPYVSVGLFTTNIGELFFKRSNVMI